MTDTKTAEERITASEYSVYYQWAHEYLEAMGDDREANANMLASLCIAMVEFKAAEARREDVKIAKDMLYNDDMQHLSWADACAEIAKAIEQLGDSDHE